MLIPEGAAYQGSTVRAPPVGCANPGVHSWACGCCRVWDHCATCNCYWYSSGRDFAHIHEQDVEEGIVQDLEHLDRMRAELGGLDEEDIISEIPEEPEVDCSITQEMDWMDKYNGPWEDKRRRYESAEDRQDDDIAACVRDDECVCGVELHRALAMAAQEDDYAVVG